MKNKIPSEGLRLGRDSGSILCDTLKKVAFSDSLGGVKRMMPIWRQACGLSLRCRWYILDWHSSLLFTFYKAQKYKDFLKRQKILDIFLRNVEIKGIFVVMTNYCRDFTLYKSVFQLRLPWGGAVLHKVKTLQQ